MNIRTSKKIDAAVSATVIMAIIVGMIVAIGWSLFTYPNHTIIALLVAWVLFVIYAFWRLIYSTIMND
jgi:hypothetical protein